MITRVKSHMGTFMDYPTNRADAKAQKAKYYFTGKPCSKGHIALRKTKGCCVECMKEDWIKDNERRKELPKSEASKAAGRRYYEKNKDLVKAKAFARPVEDKRRYKSKFKIENPTLYKVLVNVRRRRHRQATPAWLTQEQRDAIKQLYIQAQKLTELTGVRYEVDHIIPISHDDVCGLHVPWNLQVIPKEENLKKSNKISCTPST